ncbi:unnamed protein product (macronuclear) [Paramecium tetraurelia]|uniref:Uncharacterized protein n=1 Tax=Paramecium tetraurelia TaxID=5888 RepID=A0CMW3_PARTE|nr:uncharacterized protein GSPATT00038748001 [Paramecium tetraurelia]CAK72130.1 unnamed protein product [Paramecium tetraurelia]|eukprot:XP_001439527.1 hypothetical protein (macronuclear) [Paramecium tetraurelia strain d4-2]
MVLFKVKKNVMILIQYLIILVINANIHAKAFAKLVYLEFVLNVFLDLILMLILIVLLLVEMVMQFLIPLNNATCRIIGNGRIVRIVDFSQQLIVNVNCFQCAWCVKQDINCQKIHVFLIAEINLFSNSMKIVMMEICYLMMVALNVSFNALKIASYAIQENAFLYVKMDIGLLIIGAFLFVVIRLSQRKKIVMMAIQSNLTVALIASILIHVHKIVMNAIKVFVQSAMISINYKFLINANDNYNVEMDCFSNKRNAMMEIWKYQMDARIA